MLGLDKLVFPYYAIRINRWNLIISFFIKLLRIRQLFNTLTLDWEDNSLSWLSNFFLERKMQSGTCKNSFISAVKVALGKFHSYFFASFFLLGSSAVLLIYIFEKNNLYPINNIDIDYIFFFQPSIIFYYFRKMLYLLYHERIIKGFN